jgi:methionine-rich copper-binding protein CopC
MLATRLLRRAFLALILLGTAQAADAHAILMSGYPLPNSTMPAGTAAIRLRFNSRIDVARSRLTLITPDGAEHRLHARPGPTPDIMEADTPISAGAGELHWQVLAIDGHITRGVIPFTAMAR